eukprot:TRINITY_DN16746_c0_g1_i1.p1 TRINITY_DN16746_c0_g1~~TRINITY_DN16746_c0_g1_i1.p1  ORF type:complete len:620 (+),score=97.05 TRINITY_DN16746_c0_g1_i1:15-1874(+)
MALRQGMSPISEEANRGYHCNVSDERRQLSPLTVSERLPRAVRDSSGTASTHAPGSEGLYGGECTAGFVAAGMQGSVSSSPLEDRLCNVPLVGSMDSASAHGNFSGIQCQSGSAPAGWSQAFGSLEAPCRNRPTLDFQVGGIAGSKLSPGLSGDSSVNDNEISLKSRHVAAAIAVSTAVDSQQGGYDDVPQASIHGCGSTSPHGGTPWETSCGVSGGGGVLDLDVTVMAYAQWLSEMKRQATSVRLKQTAEIDIMRDAMAANRTELADFKRQYTNSIQQLQSHVSELRTRLKDLACQMSVHEKQYSEHQRAIGSLQVEVDGHATDIDMGRRTWADHVDRLQADVGNVRKALGSSQDQTLGKFGEVDQALCLFRDSIASMKREFGETKDDCTKGQELLGQAITTVSQDFADFQRHTSTVTNKLQSDVYHVEEKTRDYWARWNKTEGQLAGLQEKVYHTTNDLILLREEQTPLDRSEGDTAAVPRLERQFSTANSGCGAGINATSFAWGSGPSTNVGEGVLSNQGSGPSASQIAETQDFGNKMGVGCSSASSNLNRSLQEAVHGPAAQKQMIDATCSGRNRLSYAQAGGMTRWGGDTTINPVVVSPVRRVDSSASPQRRVS